MGRELVAIVALAACGKGNDTPAKPPPPPAATPSAPSTTAGTPCEALPFAATTPVPEASGAAWIQFRGKPALFVLSDSGNDGAYGIVDPDTGDTVAQGKLGHAERGDDYEGVTTRGGKLVALISNGWYVDIAQDGERFTAGKPIALGEPAELAGKNFEGICLDDRAAGDGCHGFAASKADGHLYCLTEQAGQLRADFTRSIAIARNKRLADCAIDDRGTLWAGANIFELGKVWRVEDWRDPAHANVRELGALSVGNPEVLAVRGDVVYRMSDLDTAPSMMAKFRCRPIAR
ncbi:MAG: hypothetical protein ACM31C_15655 [Acidobacteriota bacterium]